MKQFLSILLTVCLILAAFAGCEAPVNDGQNPGTTLPTGNSEPTGSNNNTGSNNSTGATEGNGVVDSTKPTEGNGTSESTEPTEGNGSAENSQPTGGNPGQNTTPKGEPITEAQFNAITSSTPTNYSYFETRTYQGKTTSVTMLINGKEYLQTRVEDNTTRKILSILRGDSAKDYMFNEDTGKWETSNVGIVTSFPLNGFPFPLSNFTYDENSGAYCMTIEGNQMQMMFKDGQLVFLGIIEGENQDLIYFSDYGTTVIPMPAESDIVDTNNNVQTGTSDNH